MRLELITKGGHTRLRVRLDIGDGKTYCPPSWDWDWARYEAQAYGPRTARLIRCLIKAAGEPVDLRHEPQWSQQSDRWALYDSDGALLGAAAMDWQGEWVARWWPPEHAHRNSAGVGGQARGLPTRQAAMAKVEDRIAAARKAAR